jgi:hypothetical protein
MEVAAENGKESSHSANANGIEQNRKQQMRTILINVLIQFFLSSTCLEHLVFIIRKTTVHPALNVMIFMRFDKHSSR